MQVAVDARALAARRGVARYTRRMLEALAPPAGVRRLRPRPAARRPGGGGHAELKERGAGMRAQWEGEKEQAEGQGKLRERLDEARGEFERATRDGDLERAGQLRYGEIPELERKLAEAESRESDELEPAVYLSEKVDAEEIAEVVGKWTGIPVTRLVEGEVEKLVH